VPARDEVPQQLAAELGERTAPVRGRRLPDLELLVEARLRPQFAGEGQLERPGELGRSYAQGAPRTTTESVAQ
jgi:hypothetical protein